jgi:hypothetical protein
MKVSGRESVGVFPAAASRSIPGDHFRRRSSSGPGE